MDIERLKQHYDSEYHDFIKKTYYKIKQLNSGRQYSYIGFVNPLELEIIKVLSGDRIKVVNLNTSLERTNILLEQNNIDSVFHRISMQGINLMIDYNEKFGEITHPQLLGTLLNSDISFQDIGEITFSIDGNIYLEVSNALGNELINSGLLINKIPIKFIEVKTIGLKKAPKMLQFFVKSLRVDTIVKSICKVSKNKAHTLINSKSIRVNYQVETKASSKIKENDVISIRRYGKFKIAGVVPTKTSMKITVEEEV